MTTRNIISYAIGIVGVLFAAFGGFLADLAPPFDKVKFAVGIASFVLLIIFLAIRVLLQIKVAKKKRFNIWLGVAGASAVIFLGSIYVYSESKEKFILTVHDRFKNEEKKYLKGDDDGMFPDHKLEKEQNNLSDQKMVNSEGDISIDESIAKIWTADSINKGRRQLTWSYILAVASLGCAIFALASLLEIGEKPKE